MDAPVTFRTLVQRHWRTLLSSLAILLDIVIHAVSFLLAAAWYLRTFGLEQLVSTIGGLFTLSTLVYIGAFTLSGIYRTIAYSSLRAQAFRAVRAGLMATPVVVSLFYMLS